MLAQKVGIPGTFWTLNEAIRVIMNRGRYSPVPAPPRGRSWEKQQEWLRRKHGGERAWGFAPPCLQHHVTAGFC